MAKNRWAVELGQGMGELELGVERDEILRRLAEQNIDYDADDDDPVIYVPDLEVQLCFSETAPPVLRQISVESDEVRFGPAPVIGERLHDITSLLRVGAGETLWRRDADSEDSLPGREIDPDEPLEPASDRELLGVGTLWVLPLGLGLRVYQGAIREVILRLPADSPTTGLGPLTDAQIEFCRRGDFSTTSTSAKANLPAGQRWFRFLVGFGFFVAVAVIAWQAAQYHLRWQAAPKATATVIVVTPDTPDTLPDSYVVSYLDQGGTERQAMLTWKDMDVSKKVGETVEVQYLPEAPDQPLLLSRVSDAAFVKFFPYLIAALGTYLVLMLAGSIVGMALR